uniref:Uncharacterized protein n=1 Tax=Acrobeloides nanus TaxID=290746 RepID=A0A914EP83_9BILA
MAESCAPPPYEPIAHPNPTSEYGYKQTSSEQLQPPAYEDDARFASVTSISYRMMLQPPPGYVAIRTRDDDTFYLPIEAFGASKRKHRQQIFCLFCGFLVFIVVILYSAMVFYSMIEANDYRKKLNKSLLEQMQRS